MTIEPDIDAYGKLARARTGGLCRVTRTAPETMHQGAVVRFGSGQMESKADSNGYTGLDDDEDSDSYADQAFNVLDERIDILGDRYPFRMTGPRLGLKPNAGVANNLPYVSLLCITIAHAFGVQTPKRTNLYLRVSSVAP